MEQSAACCWRQRKQLPDGRQSGRNRKIRKRPSARTESNGKAPR